MRGARRDPRLATSFPLTISQGKTVEALKEI